MIGIYVDTNWSQFSSVLSVLVFIHCIIIVSETVIIIAIEIFNAIVFFSFFLLLSDLVP